MKRFLVFALVVLCSGAIAQTRKTFLDGKEINYANYIMASKSIDNIRVENEDGNQRVMITLTKPTKYIPLTKMLRDRSECQNLKKNPVYNIEGRLLYDISEIIVDKNYRIASINTFIIAPTPLLDSTYYNRPMLNIMLEEITEE